MSTRLSGVRDVRDLNNDIHNPAYTFSNSIIAAMFRLRLTKMRQRHFPFRIWFSQSAAVMGNLEKLVKDGSVGGFKLMSLVLNQLKPSEAFEFVCCLTVRLSRIRTNYYH